MLTHAKALVIDSWQISDICPPNETLTLANQPTLQASADSDRQVSADHRDGWQALGDIYDDDGVLTSLTLSERVNLADEADYMRSFSSSY